MLDFAAHGLYRLPVGVNCAALSMIEEPGLGFRVNVLAAELNANDPLAIDVEIELSP